MLTIACGGFLCLTGLSDGRFATGVKVPQQEAESELGERTGHYRASCWPVPFSAISVFLPLRSLNTTRSITAS